MKRSEIEIRKQTSTESNWRYLAQNRGRDPKRRSEHRIVVTENDSIHSFS
jgi:hypothetical protein